MNDISSSDAPRVAVLSCDNADHEAKTIANLLEGLGCSITLSKPASIDEFELALSNGEQNCSHIVICAKEVSDDNANTNGFCFGTHTATADELRGKTNLKGIHVVSTAGSTGSDTFADVFLNAGARSYVAPEATPASADAMLFIHVYFHQLLTLADEQAVAVDWASGISKARFTLHVPKHDS